MTRTEASRLTGRELDAAVAETVLGWKDERTFWYTPDQDLISKSAAIACFSSDWSALGILVDKMREEGYLWMDFSIDKKHGCRARVASTTWVEGQTIPEAFARACVMAKLEE